MGDHVSGHNSVELGWPAPATGDQSENEVEVKEDIEVGGRYRVWWPSEEKWYTGTVTSRFKKKGNKWRMKYDDGDRQVEEFRKPWCISLKEEQHEAGETEGQHKKGKQQTREQEDAAAQETATDFNETCEDLFGNSEEESAEEKSEEEGGQGEGAPGTDLLQDDADAQKNQATKKREKKRKKEKGQLGWGKHKKRKNKHRKGQDKSNRPHSAAEL
jgi:hypothetical protein